MGFKSIIILSGFICLVRSEDLFLGNGTEGKRIFDEEEKASPTIWRQIHNVTVNATVGEVISKIAVNDLRPDKKGEARIIEGGLGHENVTIELKSPTALRGYEFHIEVFSVPESEGKSLFDAPSTNLDSITKNPDNTENVQVPAIVAEDTNEDKRNKHTASSTPLPNKEVKIYEVTTPKTYSEHKMDAKVDTKRAALDVVTETSRREFSTSKPLNTNTKAETLITIEDASKINHQHNHASPTPTADGKNVATPKSLENKEQSMDSLENHDSKELTHPLFNIHQSTQAPISTTSGSPLSTSTAKLNEKRDTLDKHTTSMPDNHKLLTDTKESPVHLANDKGDVTTEKVNQLSGSTPGNLNKDLHLSTHKPVPLM